jgi:hypothetical protein
MKIILKAMILFAGVLFMLNSGCSDTLNTDNTKIVFPLKNIDFQTTVYPFMKTTCAMQSCHASENPAAALPLAEYFDLFNNGMVVPGKPDESRLILYLSKKVIHSQSAVYIQCTDAQLKGMRQWILEGAKISAN